MGSHDPKALIREVFETEGFKERRREALEIALAAVRRKRQQQRLLKTAGASILSLIALALLSTRIAPTLDQQTPFQHSSVQTIGTQPLSSTCKVSSSRAYTVQQQTISGLTKVIGSQRKSIAPITDDELLALYAGQGAMIVRERGQTPRLVLAKVPSS